MTTFAMGVSYILCVHHLSSHVKYHPKEDCFCIPTMKKKKQTLKKPTFYLEGSFIPNFVTGKGDSS